MRKYTEFPVIIGGEFFCFVLIFLANIKTSRTCSSPIVRDEKQKAKKIVDNSLATITILLLYTLVGATDSRAADVVRSFWRH